MDKQKYLNALYKHYEKYGELALLDEKIQEFIKIQNDSELKADEIRKDLDKIAKWHHRYDLLF